ncbi:nucleoid-associated protein [Hathewaya histolytica]|uniref:Nucleoid-associated protein n=1 Tax=Hathewaya histolytica TaxID=1498 RepID=A0A4U9R1F8_HATHI|nr:nucleoid-associated protein [Hathewaya histolytica]VTQ84955.1 nucleoid-associated protein [Hathewaya histolytica]
MEYIREININEAIIHILDNNSEEPILNEFSLDLTDEIYGFLYKHIQKLLRDEELRYAVFKEGRNIVQETSREYLSGHNNLLEVSKELGRQMFSLIKSKGSASSCDLIIVSISTEYGPMLAILKMDYVKNYMHNIEFVEEKIGINIIPQITGLPASSQKIQKAAFIKPVPSEEGFDLMVIDKKKGSKKEEDYGTNYFIDNYLGCEIVVNERDMTKGFLETAEQWTRENLSDNADKAEKLRRKVKEKLKEEDEIDLKEFTSEVFEDGEESNFLSYVKENGLDENISVDKEWVEKKLKRVRLKIDGDIDVYLSEEAYKDFTRFQIKRNGDGTIDMVIKGVRNYIEK